MLRSTFNNKRLTKPKPKPTNGQRRKHSRKKLPTKRKLEAKTANEAKAQAEKRPTKPTLEQNNGQRSQILIHSSQRSQKASQKSANHSKFWDPGEQRRIIGRVSAQVTMSFTDTVSRL